MTGKGRLRGGLQGIVTGARRPTSSSAKGFLRGSQRWPVEGAAVTPVRGSRRFWPGLPQFVLCPRKA